MEQWDYNEFGFYQPNFLEVQGESFKTPEFQKITRRKRKRFFDSDKSYVLQKLLRFFIKKIAKEAKKVPARGIRTFDLWGQKLLRHFYKIIKLLYKETLFSNFLK